MTRIVLILTVFASAFIASVASAVDGVEKVSIKVSGKEYVFPVGDMRRKSDIYYLKRFLEDGDKTALEMFLGTRPSRIFYIGDDSPIWLNVSKDKVEVKSG